MEQRDKELAARLLGSLLTFTRVFYKLQTGKEFVVSDPFSRESHHITICKALTKVLLGEIKRLVISVPPRYGKTTLLHFFLAWAQARYADSNFLYISYSGDLAAKQTHTIKDILQLPQYRKLFGVELRTDSQARDNYMTTKGGNISAVGAGGSITGKGAGIKHSNRFGGAIVIDDIHKPDEATSDIIRDGIKSWYHNTLRSRLNDPQTTPIVIIGQRVHEDDLIENLLSGFDGDEWEYVVIPALDAAGNALDPSMHTKEDLLKLKEASPYEFAAQYQQNPVPAGGGIFKPEWFPVLEDEPAIISSFITCDTAETTKDYNDWTVFSFWGLYKITQGFVETDVYGLHLLDCFQFRCEPKDLQNEFLQFYASAMRHPIKPKLAAIEKKSTGVTLSSTLKSMQGLRIIELERTSASGSKSDRFLEMQQYISQKLITVPAYKNFTPVFIEHMAKITANNSHRFDDICDTVYDAVKLSFIDKSITAIHSETKQQESQVINAMAAQFRTQFKARGASLCRR